MGFFTTKLQLVVERARAELRHYPESWWASTWDFGPGQVVWFISHEASRAHLPAAAQGGAILAIPGDGLAVAGQSGGFENHISPISKTTMRYTDVGGALSHIIAEKYANEVGTRDKIHRTYRWPAGEDLDTTKHLLSTYMMLDRQTGDGTKEIQCTDVQRELKTKIWKPHKYHLSNSISKETVDDIIIYSETAPVFFEHDHNYSSDPNKTISYFRTPEDEIIGFESYSFAKSGDTDYYRLGGVTRGALGSFAVAVEVDEDEKITNKPELEEWTYFEEFTADFIRGLTTGQTYDGRVVPWNSGTDSQWIDDVSLAYVAPDLNLLRWHAENYGEISVKELFEKELLPFMPGIMLVNPEGEIYFHRMTAVSEVGSEGFVFNLSNVYANSISSLRTKNQQIVKRIELEYDYDARTKVFNGQIEYTDPSSERITPKAGTYSLKSKLLHNTLHTQAQVHHLISVIGDIKFHEYVEIEFDALPSTRHVEVGQRVRCDFGFRRDDSTNTDTWKSVNRAFVITEREPTDEGGWHYTAYATRQRASSALASQLAQHLPDSAHRENAFNLALVPGIQIVDNFNGTHTLIADVQLSLNQKYYFDKGALIIQDGVRITANDFGPQLEIWITAAFQLNGIIDIAGQGLHAGGAAGELGERGYAMPTLAGGGLVITPRYYESSGTNTFGGLSGVGGDVRADRAEFESREPIGHRDYTGGDVPKEILSLNDGRLVGLPPDLSGYGGNGSGESSFTTASGTVDAPTTVAGLPGGRSGPGLRIVHRGFSHGANAKIIVNGAAGTPGESRNVATGLAPFEFWRPSGGGGGPGSVRLHADGGYPLTDVTPIVEARPGESEVQGERLSSPLTVRGAGTLYRSFYEPSANENWAVTATQHTRIPRPDSVQVRPPSQLEQFLIEAYLNSKLRVTSGTTFPSNANVGDYTISQQRADSSVLEPIMYRFTNNDWKLVDWTVGDALARLHLDNYRNSGKTTIRGGNTRPVDYDDGDLWFDAATEIVWRLFHPPLEDVIFQEKGVRLGEELIEDPNWTRTAAGESLVTFTRDTGVSPINVLNRIAAAIALAFVSVDGVAGDFVLAGSEPITNNQLPPPPTLDFAITSQTEGTVTWTAPADLTDVTNFEVYRDGVVIATVANTVTAHAMTDLVASTTYTVAVKSLNSATGERSACLTSTKTTPDVGGSAFSVTVSNSGPNVQGVAAGYDEGRQIRLTLNDSTFFTDDINAVGAFQFSVPAGPAAANNNKEATLYINNGDSSTELLERFNFTA